MNADKIKFRCSSLGDIMTNDRSGKQMGETAKKKLVEVFVLEKYGRKKDIPNKYITKGLAVEEDSITLYSRVNKTFYKKNSERLNNRYISGEPDLYIGEEIFRADTIIDIKSSWDIHTFFATTAKKLNSDYYWQMQGYMDLTGAASAKLAYCLVNTPEQMINDAKRRLSWQMGVIDEENSPEFKEACVEIEKNMIYDDIPLKERVIEIVIERDEDAIKSIHDRVIDCREYLNEHYFKTEVA